MIMPLELIHTCMTYVLKKPPPTPLKIIVGKKIDSSVWVIKRAIVKPVMNDQLGMENQYLLLLIGVSEGNKGLGIRKYCTDCSVGKGIVDAVKG
jgi:hypothetical protein